jgi:hypothetical protein
MKYDPDILIFPFIAFCVVFQLYTFQYKCVNLLSLIHHSIVINGTSVMILHEHDTQRMWNTL